MSALRPGAPGSTRECPHCKATILESAAVCPACRHHLRFETGAAASAGADTVVPLRVEGSILHPDDAAPWEYSVVVTVHDDRGQEIARKLVSVGALHPGEKRNFSLSVEATPAKTKGGTRH